MKRKISLFGITLFLAAIAAAVFLIMGKSPALGASTAQSRQVECTSILISPEDNTSQISGNSVMSTESGEIFYLIPNADRTAFDLIYVQADDTVRKLGTIAIAELGYDSPQWLLDTENHSIIFVSKVANSNAATFELESIDYSTGERKVLGTMVNPDGFGEIEDFIWWSGSEGQTIFYNPETSLSTMVNFPQSLTSLSTMLDFPQSLAGTAAPIRLLPDNEALFGLLWLDESDGRIKTQYYRGKLETGESWPLHEDEVAISSDSYTDSSLVLENSIVYINSEGILKEIDFAGNILRAVELQGTGFYSDMISMSSGIVYLYQNYQDFNLVSNSLYFVSQDDTVTQLTPDGINFQGTPISLDTLSTSSGQEQLWFNIDHSTDYENGTLVGFSISPDAAPAKIFEMSGISDFDLSPNGNYLIAGRASEAIVISTDSLEEIATLGSFPDDRIFSPNEDKVYFSVDDSRTIYVHDFATAQRQTLTVSEREYPYIFYADNEDELLYFFDSGHNENSFDRQISVSTFDGADSAFVNLEEVQIPYGSHTAAFLSTNSGDIVYFGKDWQSLYRAHCE